jgi:diguanylate cyclase (GGDEF)-like protein
MPSFTLPPLFLQLLLPQAGQLLLVMGIAFATITLIRSAVRFQRLIEMDDEELNTTEDRNQFFFIQVARFLSRINRKSTGFGILIVQFQSDASTRQPAQEKLLRCIQRLTRDATDTTCLFNDDCVAAILDTEDEDLPTAAKRIIKNLQSAAASIPEITGLRAGCSGYPAHGRKSSILIEAASSALEKASFDAALPLQLEEAPDAPDAPTEEDTETDSTHSKNSNLDPLTGVLKPEAIGSFMRKYLADLRYKKEPAAVLCIGINNIENMISLHDEETADAVIAGVSEVLQRLTRSSDLIGRFKRDDFVILATCTLEQGEIIATRLREAVLKEAILFEGKHLKTSISVGISGHPEHGRALRLLFEGAQTALNVIRSWETSSCLTYDPSQHNPKNRHEKPTQTRR